MAGFLSTTNTGRQALPPAEEWELQGRRENEEERRYGGLQHDEG